MSYINQLTLLDGTTVDLEAKNYDGEPIPVAKGGTGASTESVARTNLGLGTAATYDVESTVANDSKLPTGAAVKSFVEGKGYITTDTNNRRAFYGTCATAAATKNKVVTLSNTIGWELLPGTIVGVKFTYTNTYSSSASDPITLNVNGTGAKNIWYNTTHSGVGNTGTSTAIYGVANRYTFYMYDGTYWVWIHNGVTSNSNTVPSAQCETGATTAAKTATCTNYTLTANTYLHFNIRYANTVAGAITMNVNSKGAKPIYINGAASSSSNYTLPAGTYIAFYNGTYWHFRTDGKLPASISGDAATVNGHTVGTNVPSNAVFTDTTELTSMTGTLAIDHGGTGANTAQLARQMLGLGSASTMTGSNILTDNDEILPTGSAVVDYIGYYLDMRLRGWNHNQTNLVYGKDTLFPGFNDANRIYNSFTSTIAQSSIAYSSNYKSVSFKCGNEDDCITWELGTELVSELSGHTVRFMFDSVDTYDNGGARITFSIEYEENVDTIVKTYIGSRGNDSDYDYTDASVVLGDNVIIDYEFPENLHNFYVIFGHIYDSTLTNTSYDTLNIDGVKVYDITG